MGGCAAKHLIEDVDGDEQAYHKRYLEDKILGEGQFGVVKLVHDISASKEVETEPMACKSLQKGVQFKDNTLYSPLKPEILRGECDILKTLAGQHFCLRLIGVYESPRVIYMVTELCLGGEMMQYVAKQDELRTEDVSRISFQLIDAVNHCAKHGVIHRDIKPENTMFRTIGAGAELRLIDFGSGTKDPLTSDTEIQKHTTFAGSGLYISPEVFQRAYTSKTDVWSAGVTLYVLVAGYPADRLQAAYNMLHSAKRNLRELPQMPEQMPDSFIDLLDALLTYKPTARKSAGDMLTCEFLTFHKTLEENGLSLDDIAAEAAEHSTPLPESSIMRRKTHSVILSGSVQRHSMFLDYQKFERSVTTLLATLLVKTDFDSLLAKLEKHHTGRFEEQVEVEAGSSRPVLKLQKLQVILMNELYEILRDMKQDRVLKMINQLPSAATYANFAYHSSLLKQFVADIGQKGARPLSGTGRNVGKSSSVHGNHVFDKRFSKAHSVLATNKDNSWHAGQRGVTKSASYAK